MVKAVIMAGGEGSRLRPLTVTRPKPMVPFLNKPILERLVILLRESGIREIGVTLHYQPNSIISYFGDGSRHGVSISYSVEERPLGTAGGVKNFVERMGWDDTLLIISGDVVTNIDIKKMLKKHEESSSVFTMASRRESDPTRFGIIAVDGSGRVVKFKEKPSPSELFSDVINMGIYVVEPEVFKLVPSSRAYDFASDLIPRLLSEGAPVYAVRMDEYYWSDIGDLDQYRESQIEVLSRGLSVPGGIDGREVARGVFVGRDAEVDLDAVSPPVVVGDGAKAAGARLGPHAIIGRGAVVERESVVERSVIFDNAVVGPSCHIEGAVIGESAVIGDRTVVSEGAVIGDETKIGRGVFVKPKIKIWPSKVIDSYTVVSMDVRWGIRWNRVLIEPWGVTGILNVDLTPEGLARLGAAIGTWVREGEALAVANDMSPACEAAKHALISGILAAGASVVDLGEVPLPVLTHSIKSRGYAGGVYVTSVGGRYGMVRVKVFDRAGRFVSRQEAKKIEEAFFRETYRRGADIELGYLVRGGSEVHDYVDKLVDAVEGLGVEKLRGSRVLVDCGGGTASVVIPEIAGRLRLLPLLVNCTNLKASRTTKPEVEAAAWEAAARLAPLKDVGIGFVVDHDGDKLAVITRRGEVMAGDKLVGLVGAIMLERKPGGKILLSSGVSPSIAEFLREMGGRVELAGSGPMGLSDKLDDTYIMAADERGAIAFPGLHLGPDAFYAMAAVLSRWAEGGLEGILARMPEFSVVVKQIPVPADWRGRILRRLVEELRMPEIETLDGVKVYDEDLGWAYIRLAGAEPAVEVRVESREPEKAEKLLKVVEAALGYVLRG